MTAYDGDDVPLPLGLDYGVPVAGPRMKDKPVAYTPPEYRLAGTTMAAENVIECGQCGALLKDGNAFLHTHWHERMNNMRVSY